MMPGTWRFCDIDPLDLCPRHRESVLLDVLGGDNDPVNEALLALGKRVSGVVRRQERP